MAYVSGEEQRPSGCLFEQGMGKKHDRQSLMLYRDAQAAVFMNRYPYANGHLLIAPSRHVENLAELKDEEMLQLMRLTKDSLAILRRHLGPDGFNVGLNLGKAAGAGIDDHLHYHLVPRWQDDHNFMTVLAEVRTIPEHIEATFDRLLPSFQALGAP